MELKVKNSASLGIFYKTGYLHTDYKSFKLRRQKFNSKGLPFESLNQEPQKFSKEKYLDLKLLCEGEIPLILL